MRENDIQNNSRTPPSGPPPGPLPDASARRDWRLAGVLFLATVGTTLLAGSWQRGGNPFARPADLLLGVPFSFTLLSILLVHEMGHYLMARRHRVAASPPYFIPMPHPLIGTMGAFIRIRQQIFVKTVLMDIGAAGPLAGVVVAVAALVVGLPLSEQVTVTDTPLSGGLELGNCLLFHGLSTLLVGNLPEEIHLVLHPVAFAGWVGLFVTCLNLLPAGQLDGGHIAYAMWGERHRYISRGTVVVLAVAGVFGWAGWLVWAMMILLIGLSHPPTVDAPYPLDPRRRRLGWLSMAVFALTFTPNPFTLIP